MARPIPGDGVVPASLVIECFNRCFSDSERTLLCGGAEEPYYQPGDGDGYARIWFRADYVRSALHEVAHWCHAGSHRRQLADYGYWYTPDDRNVAQQAAFFAVEARPQALESLFCDRLGIPFRASVDNLSLEIPEATLQLFLRRLQAAREAYQASGLPPRAHRFAEALDEVLQCAPLVVHD